MSFQDLNKLVKSGELQILSVENRELQGLLKSAQLRITDATNTALSQDSRFDLACNAAHAAALAALRWHGYRCNKRFEVFQYLEHTLNLDKTHTKIFVICHGRRNIAEYEGRLEIDDKLLEELINATQKLITRVTRLGPV